MTAFLDAALRSWCRRPRRDTYRLVRPTFVHPSDAFAWLMTQPAWHGPHDSATGRRLALGTWIWLRQRHHVAWVERGGSE
jgi:hypothetical protein